MELRRIKNGKTYEISIRKYEKGVYRGSGSVSVYQDVPMEWLLNKLRDFLDKLTPETRVSETVQPPEPQTDTDSEPTDGDVTIEVKTDA